METIRKTGASIARIAVYLPTILMDCGLVRPPTRRTSNGLYRFEMPCVRQTVWH